jgi:hypothetical protein
MLLPEERAPPADVTNFIVAKTPTFPVKRSEAAIENDMFVT